MISHQKISQVKPRLFIPASRFDKVNVAPTVTITKAAIIATTEIGLSADANAAALVNNGIAATRTGITGVQAPVIVAANSANVPFQAISTLGLIGALLQYGFGEGPLCVVPIPYDADRSLGLKCRAWWTTSSTTTTKIIEVQTAVKTYSDSETLDAAALDQVFYTPADAPSGTAYQLQITPWSNESRDWASDTDVTMQVAPIPGSNTDENFWLLGLEFEYYPKAGLPSVARA